MSDYSYWRNAMAGQFGPVHDGDPQPGFYRARVTFGREVPWTPVAIWDDGNGLVAVKHAYIVEKPLIVPADDVWSYCCDNPISEAAYRAVAERGQMWPSEHYSKRMKS